MRSFTPASGIKVNEYLASMVGVQFDSATVNADSVSTVDSDNRKYLNKGVVLSRINTPAAASGMAGPYDPTATDGRQYAYNIAGVNDTFADLANGDVEVGVLIAGVVKESKITMGSAVGALPPTYKELLRNAKIDIRFN